MPCKCLQALLVESSTLENSFCIYSRLKLFLESIIQYTYYRLKGIDSFEEFIAIIRKRTKTYASFKAAMILNLKGVHGSKKRKLLRTYLKLSEYLHPSHIMWTLQELYIDEQLVKEILDLGLYVTMIAEAKFKSVCSNYINEIRACGFSESFRLLSKES